MGGSKPKLHLRPGKALGKELRKVALLQIDAAIRELRDNNVSPEPVHNARTYIKKVRAVLRFCSPVLSKRERKTVAVLLRDAAERLSSLRDSDVHVLMVDELLERNALLVDDYSSLRTGMADMAKQRRINGVRQIPRVVELLKKIRDAIADWPMEELQGKDLRKILEKTYRRGRNLLQKCHTDTDLESFHAWRKQVKQLCYQMRITERFWSDEAQGTIETLETIAEFVGEERDLALLQETLVHGPKSKPAANLREKIVTARHHLQTDAVKKGSIFYSLKPGFFIKALDL